MKFLNTKSDNQASYNETSYKYINNISKCRPSQFHANVINFNEKDESKYVNVTTRGQDKDTLQAVSSKSSTSQTKVVYILKPTH